MHTVARMRPATPLLLPPPTTWTLRPKFLTRPPPAPTSRFNIYFFPTKSCLAIQHFLCARFLAECDKEKPAIIVRVTKEKWNLTSPMTGPMTDHMTDASQTAHDISIFVLRCPYWPSCLFPSRWVWLLDGRILQLARNGGAGSHEQVRVLSRIWVSYFFPTLVPVPCLSTAYWSPFVRVSLAVKTVEVEMKMRAACADPVYTLCYCNL
ncbi:hypothetical protein B0H10DRAFT_2075662 [Mycena sp. CBHHK59/15]|nr:hypothetical protein B0H10DRAFT_2075662 [Mycena sp. CBHHK59/15]